jgi:O-antigen ligase
MAKTKDNLIHFYDGIKKSINIINLVSAIMLMASLITSQFSIIRLLYSVFFLTYIIEIISEKKWIGFKVNKLNIYFIALLLFFMLFVFYLAFENTNKYSHLLFEKRVALLGFSIVGLLGVNKLFKLSYLLNAMVISSVLAIIYNLFINVGIVEFVINPNRFDIFNEARKELISSHMNFNFYLNLSIISIWFLLTRTWRRIAIWRKILYFAALIIILSALSISEGRSGFLIALLLFSSFIFIEIWRFRRRLSIVIAMFIPLIIGFGISQHDRMSMEMLKSEPRWFLWESGLDVIKQSPIVGHGASNAQELFDISREKFQTEEYKNQWSFADHLDSHNQYIQTTMEFGLIGLALLLFLFIYPLFVVDVVRRPLALFVISLIAYQSIFDMFLTGPFSLLFGMIVLILMVVPHEYKKRSIKETN